jgi:prepilin-type N-terminal cleavage/methylation domain-containing protein
MKQTGFTLIELILVIVILGIMAVIALPKFSNLQNDAEQAVVKNTAGALQSGVKIAQLKWRTSGEQRNNLALTGPNTSANFSNMVDFSQFGCPVQHWQINNEANPSANNATDCLTVFLLIMNRCNTAATDCGGQADDQFTHSYLGSGVCEYTYRDNTNYKIRYETNTEDCAVTTSGL